MCMVYIRNFHCQSEPQWQKVDKMNKDKHVLNQFKYLVTGKCNFVPFWGKCKLFKCIYLKYLCKLKTSQILTSVYSRKEGVSKHYNIVLRKINKAAQNCISQLSSKNVIVNTSVACNYLITEF